MFITAMIFYGEFVFDIKVNGNERLSDKYIIDALENSGFRVGSFIPDIDFDELSNKVPIEYGDISWIFVNMMGNVAQVEVREYKKDQENKGEAPPAEMTDLVATEYGQIYRFEVSDGITKVSIGDVVSRGQILVSGMEKGEKAGFFLFLSRQRLTFSPISANMEPARKQTHCNMIRRSLYEEETIRRRADPSGIRILPALHLSVRFHSGCHPHS